MKSGKTQSTTLGFTLIEMVVILLVVSIIAAVGGTALLSGVRTYQASQDSMATTAKLSNALERIIREIRPINVSAGVYAITTMTATQFVFTKSDNTQVTIAQNGSVINLGYNTPAVTSVLTDQVSTLAFKYLQRDGVTVATGAGNIVFVDIDLTLTQSGRAYQQKARVALRIKP